MIAVKPYISTTIELNQVDRRMEFIQMLERMNLPGINCTSDAIFIGFEIDDPNRCINDLAFLIRDYLIIGHEPIFINVKYYNILLDCDIIVSDKIIYIKQATIVA